MANKKITGSRKSHNYLGEVYDQPMRLVDDLAILEPGDHIAFHRSIGALEGAYWHHGIVEQVHRGNFVITIIHFEPPYDTKHSNKLKGKVVRDAKLFLEEEIYVVQYDPKEVLPPDMVIAMARSMLDCDDYHLLQFNCEHLASRCKTGSEKSFQAQTFGKVLGKCGAVAGGKTIVRAGLQEAAENLPAQAVKSAGRKAFAAGAAIEAGFVAYDVADAVKKWKKGVITRRECEDAIGTRISVGVGNVSISVLGGVIGGSVAGPLGAVVGGIAGGVVGTVVGAVGGKIGCSTRDKVEHEMKKGQLAILN